MKTTDINPDFDYEFDSMTPAQKVLTKYSDGHYSMFPGYENILMAMEEYASQRSLTDEEIEESAKEFQHDTTTSFNQGMYSGYIFGMQAYRKAIRDRQKGYEKEFVEWYILNTGKAWAGKYYVLNKEESFNSLDELHEYWEREVKNK